MLNCRLWLFFTSVVINLIFGGIAMVLPFLANLLENQQRIFNFKNIHKEAFLKIKKNPWFSTDILVISKNQPKQLWPRYYELEKFAYKTYIFRICNEKITTYRTRTYYSRGMLRILGKERTHNVCLVEWIPALRRRQRRPINSGHRGQMDTCWRPIIRPKMSRLYEKARCIHKSQRLCRFHKTVLVISSVIQYDLIRKLTIYIGSNILSGILL